MQAAIGYLRVSTQEQGRSGLRLASGFVVSAVRREKKKRRPLDNAAEW
jgi:DNA invertase Pin-like site-specific DNA recombinase